MTGVAVGSCEITLTISATGYDDLELNNDVDIVAATMGAITWPNNAYSVGDITVPGTKALANAPTIASPTDTTVAYSSTTPSICSVNAANGTITGVDDGTCIVRATFSKTGYGSDIVRLLGNNRGGRNSKHHMGGLCLQRSG